MHNKKEFNMRTLLLTTIAAMAIGTTVSAQGTSATLDTFATKSGNADTVFAMNATADFSFGITSTIDMLVGGELSFTDFPDSEEVELTEWHVGVDFGAVAATAGKQEDLFTGSLMRELGGDALANPTGGEYSLIASASSGAAYVGYDNATDEWTNVQVAAYFTPSVMLAQNVAVVLDYQNASNDLAIAAEVNGSFNQLNTGAVATYSNATEAFGYEGMIGWSMATVDVAGFVGGSTDTDMVDYVGAGASMTFNTVELWSEVAYNIESESSDVAVGVSLSF
jgi:hypothetical protein